MPKTLKPIPPILNQEYEQVSVDLLKLHPRNIRQGDTGAIFESIETNGFYGVCVVQRSTNFVLAGNHRLMAAREAGLPAVPVVYVDCDDDRALRIMLADNGTNDKATNNDSALAELLAELAKTPQGLTGTSFDGDDLDRLISDLSRPTDGDWGESLGTLPDGDKAPFQQMTFTLHDSQADLVTQAMEMAKESGPFTGSPNENSNGNALDRIACFYVTHARNR